MKVSTSQKLDWLDAVMADQGIDARAKVVAFCLMQHVNRNIGSAFVSDQTIVDKTGIPMTWVIRARKELRSAGWITWKRTRTASVYSTLTDPMASIAKRQLELKLARESRRRDMPRVAEQVMPQVTEHDVSQVAELETGVVSPVALLVVQPVAEQVLPPVADIPLSLNPVALTPSKKNLATNPEFEVWWSRFPKKLQSSRR